MRLNIEVGFVLALVAVLAACSGSHTAESVTSSLSGSTDSRAALATRCSGGAGAPASSGHDGAGDTGSGNRPPACARSFVFEESATGGGQAGAGGYAGSGDGAQQPQAVACGCTRRPGNDRSFMCPLGDGSSVTQEVGPEGGVVQLAGTASTVGVPVELRIPRNALDHNVTIRITETSIAPPEGIRDWSPLYHFEPEDLHFDSPVEVSIPWSSTSGEAGGLAIYWSDEAVEDGCTLAPLSDNYQNAGFNQGSVLSLGWAIVATRIPDGSTCP